MPTSGAVSSRSGCRWPGAASGAEPGPQRSSMKRSLMGPCRTYAMVTRRKSKSRILDAVHETASDLHRLGFVDKRKMQAYDALCLSPVPEYDAARIRELRESLRLSQSVLAAVLNTSVSTVRKWEVGDKKPSGPSSKLLDLIERKGLEAVL